MKILVSNDDGYNAKGIRTLVRLLRNYGEVTVVAPKTAQSGMSMAVTMGYAPIAVKHIGMEDGADWWYLDGTPASCVKFGIDNIFWPDKPDLVVSGINHGNNAATAALYSGTIGAAIEGSVNGVRSIGVSLDDPDADADFSGVEYWLPGILDKLLANFSRRSGTFYNINFPAVPLNKIRGIRLSTMGMAHWEHEYELYDDKFIESRGITPRKRDLWYVEHAEEGETMYVMAGDFTDNYGNAPTADHLLLFESFITITPQNLNNTDYDEFNRLCDII